MQQKGQDLALILKDILCEERQGILRKGTAMRKMFAVCAALLLALVFTSCADNSAGEEEFTRDTVPDLVLVPEGGGMQDGWVCRVSGNFVWHWPSGKDEYTVSEATGPMPTETLTRDGALHVGPGPADGPVTVRLVWQGRQPDEVSLQGVWSTDVYGADPRIPDGDFLMEGDLAQGEGGELLLELRPGAVYDICARWDAVQGESFGEAHFYFIADGPEE